MSAPIFSIGVATISTSWSVLQREGDTSSTYIPVLGACKILFDAKEETGIFSTIHYTNSEVVWLFLGICADQADTSSFSVEYLRTESLQFDF